MQTEHIHSLNLLYITLKLIVVLLEHQVDMISIFQRLTELGLELFNSTIFKNEYVYVLNLFKVLLIVVLVAMRKAVDCYHR